MIPDISHVTSGGCHSAGAAIRRDVPGGQDRDQAARVPSHGFRPAGPDTGGRTGHPNHDMQNGRALLRSEDSTVPDPRSVTRAHQ